VGDKITYHKNGTIAMISPYKKGKAHGLTKKYSETGDLLEEWLFEDGQLKSKKDYTLNMSL
jgi:antitoxin component YwqK of YwqJK toxin-antitoxin module